MTDLDGKALLSAVVDDPDDELAVYAYADWLEEQGDDEPAAFVRLRAELNAVDKLQREFDEAGVRDARRSELNRRHAALIVREWQMLHSPALREWAKSKGLQDSAEKG